jgi:hypothetical protein
MKRVRQRASRDHELRLYLDQCHAEPHVPLEVLENELLADSNDPELVDMIREHQRKSALGIPYHSRSHAKTVQQATAGKRRHAKPSTRSRKR